MLQKNVFVGCGLSMMIGLASAHAQQGPIGTYYVSDAGTGFPRTIWALQNGNVTRTAMTFVLTPPPGIITETGPLAIHGSTVATTGHYGWSNRQAQVGEIFTGAPNAALTSTHQFTLNSTTTETFWDGTSDGRYNYMVGYNSSAQGTIYRCGLDWSNPTPVAAMAQNMGFTGITYDATDNTFWVTALNSAGFASLFHFAIPPSFGQVQYISSHFLFDAPQANALAMDVDHTLWMIKIGGTMLHYSTTGQYLGSYTPTDPASVPFGGEIAPPPPPPCAADFDGNGFLDGFDYDAFVACFEGDPHIPCPPGKTADFDNDGFVSGFDYDAFVTAFETGCI